MIKVDTDSKLMRKIKSVRSLKDISNILKQINRSVQESEENAQALLDSVSKKSKSVKISISSKTRDLADLDTGKGSKRSKPISNKILNFKPPKLADLVKDSETLGLFAQQIAEIEATKLMLLGDSFANLPNTARLLKEVEKSLKEAKAARDKQLKAMSLSVNNKPKEVRSFTGLVVKHVTSTVSEEDYSDLVQKSFVLHPNKDQIWYQTYIFLNDLVAADEFIYDNYIFVCTSVVDLSNGDFKNFLTSVKGQKIPGTFDIGKELSSPSSAKRHVNMLLSADDVHVTKSLRKSLKGTRFSTTKALRNTQIMKASEHVVNVRIARSQIFFKLAEGVDRTEINEAVDDLKSAMNILYNNSLKGSSSLKHKVVRGSMTDNVLIVFNLVPSKTKSEKTLLEVEQAAKQLGMDSETTRKLKEFMV